MYHNKLIHLLFILLLVVSGISGCRAAKIYNVNDSSIAAPPGEPLQLGEIQAAIIRAGNGLGWKMNPKEEGHIVGTLFLRSHSAIVDINFNQSAFSIRYKDSTNLNHDGTNIHKNYNGWIQNLEKAINAQLSSLRY